MTLDLRPVELEFLDAAIQAASNGHGPPPLDVELGSAATRSVQAALRALIAERGTPVTAGMLRSALAGDEAALKLLPEIISAGGVVSALPNYLAQLREAERGRALFRALQTAGGQIVEGSFDEARLTVATALREDAPSGHVRVLSADELETIAPPSYLVDGLLVDGGLIVVYGTAGSLKTFLALSWSLSVATGQGWLGRRVEHGPVLYVIGEGVRGFGKRIKAWAQHHGDPSLEDFYVVPHATPFDDDLTMRELAGHVERLGIRLIVVDTLARSKGRLKENDTDDMSAIITALDTLPCTRLIVHHTGHDQTRERGSTALTGAVDAKFMLKRALGGDAMTLYCQKQKDDDEGPPIKLKPQRVELNGLATEDGRPLSSLVLEGAPDDEPPSADLVVDVESQLRHHIERGGKLTRRPTREAVRLAGIQASNELIDEVADRLKTERSL